MDTQFIYKAAGPQKGDNTANTAPPAIAAGMASMYKNSIPIFLKIAQQEGDVFVIYYPNHKLIPFNLTWTSTNIPFFVMITIVRPKTDPTKLMVAMGTTHMVASH